MHRKITCFVFCGLIFVWILSVFGPAAGQSTTKIKGVIVGRDGANVIVKADTGNVTVVLNNNTKVEAVKGRFGVRKSDQAVTALIPGLPIEVQAESTGGQMVANTIKFKADDLKTAMDMQAAMTPTNQQLKSTEQQVQANQQGIQQVQGEQADLNKRFSELGDYDTKGETIVYFAVNSAEINDTGMKDLKALAASAVNDQGYLIQVAGYTDSSGNAAYNQELSDRRAAAVVAYLQQSCAVPLFRVLAPAAMGMSNPAASNETAEGKAQNRRVDVKVIVNKGIAGQ
jgi:OOP family OmpA-OmpF porin